MSRAEKIVEIQKIISHLSEDELKECLDFIMEVEKKQLSRLSEKHLLA